MNNMFSDVNTFLHIVYFVVNLITDNQMKWVLQNIHFSYSQHFTFGGKQSFGTHSYNSISYRTSPSIFMHIFRINMDLKLISWIIHKIIRHRNAHFFTTHLVNASKEVYFSKSHQYPIPNSLIFYNLIYSLQLDTYVIY